jgi:hypothetical protein
MAVSGREPVPGQIPLRRRMLVLADHALGQTLALLATFIGIGIIVNVLIIYIVAQVWGEHQRNQQRQAGRTYESE